MKYFVFLALTCFSLFAHSEWVVDTKNSHVGFASVKNKTIAENHRLSGLTGTVGSDGQALINIDLATVETLVPIRNERIREILFDVAKFPSAIIQTKLDMDEINIINKCDKLDVGRYEDKFLYCSAKNNVGINLIFDLIKKKLTLSKSTDSATFITSSRQHINIKDAYNKTGVALENITNNDINIEILSLELREALDSIDLILGKTTPDDIINNIFSHMCVGK